MRHWALIHPQAADRRWVALGREGPLEARLLGRLSELDLHLPVASAAYFQEVPAEVFVCPVEALAAVSEPD